MLRIKAAAKINLFLDVLEKRPDGYHNINSLLQPISLFDTITIQPRPKNIATFIAPTCRFPGIPWPFSMGHNNANLITRAAKLLKKQTGCRQGAAIFLTKRIPIGAGLGGGSADAAAVLRGLNRLWKTGLSAGQLMEIGAQIGCDVPALIHGGTIRMTGRGETITPVDPPPRRDFWLLLVYPGLAVSTADIYRRFDQQPPARGCAADRKFQSILAGFKKGAGQMIGAGLFNALQKTVFCKYPLLEMIKNNLEKLGAQHVLLAGSGSTVFVFLKGKKEGRALARRIGEQIGAPLWTRVVHTVGKQGNCPMV